MCACVHYPDCRTHLINPVTGGQVRRSGSAWVTVEEEEGGGGGVEGRGGEGGEGGDLRRRRRRKKRCKGGERRDAAPVRACEKGKNDGAVKEWI